MLYHILLKQAGMQQFIKQFYPLNINFFFLHQFNSFPPRFPLAKGYNWILYKVQMHPESVTPKKTVTRGHGMMVWWFEFGWKDINHIWVVYIAKSVPQLSCLFGTPSCQRKFADWIMHLEAHCAPHRPYAHSNELINAYLQSWEFTV